MRKRTLIAIIITVVALALTNRYWFIVCPMLVDFEMHGKGECNIEVQLNKKDDNKFKHIKKQNININLNETNHAYFNVNRAKRPKRLRIIFTDFKEPVVLSAIQFRNGKFKPDLNKFAATEGKLKIENNTLTIYPEKDSVILDYPESLKIRSAIKFDFTIFVIIAVLTYLSAFKISNYVADFKSVKGKSRIEIIFLTLFFIFLFIPMSFINQDEISQKENRVLAKWKPFINNGEINYDFGKDFDSWFNDRFNLRKDFISQYRTIKYKLAYKYYMQDDCYYNKKTNWAFAPHWFILSKLTDVELQNCFENINKLNNFCKKNNIKLYILIPPTSGQIYTHEVYPFIVKNPSEVVDEFETYINKKIGKQIVINPYKELKIASKEDYVFSKSDPHWSEYGAFIGHITLMKRIQKDYKELKLPQKDDFIISKKNLIRTDWDGIYRLGYYYETLGIKQLNEAYTSFEHKDLNELIVLKSDNNTHLQETIFPKGNDLKVYMIGTSFSENLHLFAKYSFKEFHKRKINAPVGDRTFTMSRWEQDILNIKPDILLIVIQADALRRFSELY